ncbi:helix-turn-helix domain-containing protein [uncultured Microbacterium sp.]|uniref:helix-turn-helix domain-containing protein n=1 Tax=uncultured Microbacterium sp. TaxID=191216 RepID=UPI00345B5ABB
MPTANASRTSRFTSASATAWRTAADVSVRTVQEGFRKHLGTTPHEYVRNARLHAVRTALQKTDRGQTTVAETARRFGFIYPSRFPRDYLQRFGEHPSQTLRR